MIGRVVKWLTVAVLLVLLLVIAAVGYFTATEDGLQRLLSLGQRVTAPGTLSWQRIDGRLAGPLDVEGFGYQQANGLRVHIDSAALRWQPTALLQRKLHIQRLTLSGLALHLPKPIPREVSQPGGPIQLPDIDLPINIRIDELDLHDIRIFRWGVEAPIVIEQIKLTAMGGGSQLQLVQLDIRAAEGAASLSGTVEPRDNYPLDLKLDWHFNHPRFGVFTGNAVATGDLAKLHLQQSIGGAVDVALTADLTDVVVNPGWDAQLHFTTDDLAPFSPALNGAAVQAQFRSSGNLNDFSAQGELKTTLPQTGPVVVDFAARGNPQVVALEHLKLRPEKQPGELLLTGDVELAGPRLDLQGQWQHLGWPLQAETQLLRLPQGKLSVQGEPDDLRATVVTDIDGPDLGRLQLNALASINKETVTLSSLQLNGADNDLRLAAQGSLDLASQQLDVHGNWQALGWPLQGEPVVASPEGDFSASGALNDYRLSLTATLAGQNIPSGNWQLTGKGSATALPDFALAGKLLGGEVKANGLVTWKPQLSWRVSVDANNINPGAQWPDLPGNLDLTLTSQGKLAPGGPALTARLERLSGHFRGQPLRGQGEVMLADRALDIRHLDISSGNTKLTANGRLGKQWDLDWQLNAPDLTRLLPSLQGRINSRGTLSGSAASPVVTVALDIRDLIMGETGVGRLQGKGLVDISGHRRSHIDFTGKTLKLAGQSWSTLQISGGGKPHQHQLTLKLDGDLAHLRLALDGAVEAARWRGRVTRLEATKTELGDWTIAQAAPLTASAEAARLTALCLVSSPTKLCVDVDWDKQRGVTGKLHLAALDAPRFKRFLPPDITLETALDGDVDFALAANGKPQVKAKLRLRPGKLSAPGDVEPLEVALAEGHINMTLEGERAASEVTIDLGKLGRVDAHIGLASVGQPKAKLSGTVEARLNELAIISAFAPKLQAVKGVLEADLRLSGSAQQPVVTGRILIDGFAAEVPELSLQIEQGRLELASDGKGPLRIKGKARSGEGALTLVGTLDPATRALQLKLAGDRFQVAATRSIRAVISPDMQIALDSKGMRVEGELLIPSAYIKAGGGSGGEGKLVKVSSDVVIVDDNGEAAKKAPAGNFYLNLRVVLGDDIRVEAADFSGKLKGNLLVTQKPGLVPRATGAIEVVNGDYVVYGQQLKIQRGRILFGGGPVDNPRLDLDVARRVEAYDVLAGARIRGTAQAPILQLYSEPSMPDSSILSYMLLGQPPGTKGGSYTLGKYLTPDLYVGYGIGLFNAINTFNMRYRLTDKLALQAASGTASSADLIYTFER